MMPGSEHQPSDKDLLNFAPGVLGVSEFLLRSVRDGKLPLAISVEGEWGGGKTTFMRLLRERVVAEAREKGIPVKTVWFNAWRHDKDEALWAAFAVNVAGRLAREAGAWGQVRAAWKLFFSRLDLQRALWPFLHQAALLVVWLLAMAAGVILVFSNAELLSDTWYLPVVVKAAGVFLAALLVFKQTRDALGNPLAFDLRKYQRDLGYADRISFIERFHEEFGRVVRAYAGNAAVFAFIDDLDRCEPPKAADLIQSLNLLLPQGDDGEPQNLVYVVGMDREAVSAGLAVKYKDILPYLPEAAEERLSAEAEGRTAGADRDRGLRFGILFIEKFIQLPFRVPRPWPEEYSGYYAEVAPAIPARNVPQAWSDLIERPDGCAELAAFCEMASSVADVNPRRCRLFADMLRLRALVCSYTDLAQKVRLEQLAKFVLLETRWPRFVSDLWGNDWLFSELLAARAAEGQDGPSPGDDATRDPTLLAKWQADARLLDLLGWAPLDATPDVHQRYSMADFPVAAFLHANPPPDRQVAAIEQDVRNREAAVAGPRRGNEPEWDPEHDFTATVEAQGDGKRLVVDVDGVPLECVRIEPGTFTMGSPGDEDGLDDYATQHEVTIARPFYMGIYPITQAQYRAVMGTDRSYRGGADRPVNTVTWHAACKFCEFLNEKTLGSEFSLPAEAEWEYACRAGTTTRCWSGNSEADLARVGWYSANSEGRSWPVGQKPANPWGLHDMHGNVWEWCHGRPATHWPWPQTEPQGPENTRSRAVRGGSWASDAHHHWSAWRDSCSPSSSAHVLGFRVVARPE